jgi:hypothetical protein
LIINRRISAIARLATQRENDDEICPMIDRVTFIPWDEVEIETNTSQAN